MSCSPDASARDLEFLRHRRLVFQKDQKQKYKPLRDYPTHARTHNTDDLLCKSDLLCKLSIAQTMKQQTSGGGCPTS